MYQATTGAPGYYPTASQRRRTKSQDSPSTYEYPDTADPVRASRDTLLYQATTGTGAALLPYWSLQLRTQLRTALHIQYTRLMGASALVETPHTPPLPLHCGSTLHSHTREARSRGSWGGGHRRPRRQQTPHADSRVYCPVCVRTRTRYGFSRYAYTRTAYTYDIGRR